MPLFPERRVPARRIDVADLLRYDKTTPKLPSKDDLDGNSKPASLPEQKRAAAEPPKALPKGAAPEPAAAPGERLKPPSLADILGDPSGASAWAGMQGGKARLPEPQQPQLSFQDPAMNEQQKSYFAWPGGRSGRGRPTPPPPPRAPAPTPAPSAPPANSWSGYLKGGAVGTAIGYGAANYLANAVGGIAAAPVSIFNAIASGLKNPPEPMKKGKPPGGYRAQRNYSPFPSALSDRPLPEPEAPPRDLNQAPGLSKKGLPDTEVTLPDGMRHPLQFNPSKYYFLQNELAKLRAKAAELTRQGKDPRSEMDDYETLQELESDPALIVTNPATGKKINVLELSKP